MNLLVSLLLAAAVSQASPPPLPSSPADNIQKVQARFEAVESKQLVPLVSEALHFPTFAGNDQAHVEQKEWLKKTAEGLGFTVRDAGKVMEIELPGPAGAPVLGLIVHGDVQPVEDDAWTFPPFGGKTDADYLYGRGSADDKGPLGQALMAMKSLAESGVARTHTIRLLVGSTEESDTKEMAEYLEHHAAPDYSLVLDSEFPVVVGEKAWDSLEVTTGLADRPGVSKPYTVAAMMAGLSASIVPDHAEITLKWKAKPIDWAPLDKSLHAFKLPEGTRLVTQATAEVLRIVVYGKSAHAGVNIAGGRNALVALARLMEGRLPTGGADDLLAIARLGGQDLHGTGLGITDSDPLWGRYAVNVATIKLQGEPETEQKYTLTINLRRTPPRTGPQLKEYLDNFVAAFNKRSGASLVAGGYHGDEPLGFNVKSVMVQRLLADYAAATGSPAKPAISGGGTYAKRVPNAIAFGMWFPGKPYPGHDLDEKAPIADLQRGTRVLIYALTDLATGPKVIDPFK
jgi:succinyl-diaminopimelate desuccinylase